MEALLGALRGVTMHWPPVQCSASARWAREHIHCPALHQPQGWRCSPSLLTSSLWSERNVVVTTGM